MRSPCASSTKAAPQVILDAGKLEEVEKYYEECANAGTNEWQIDESKKASATMNAILGDEDRLKALAEDFAKHYENVSPKAQR